MLEHTHHITSFDVVNIEHINYGKDRKIGISMSMVTMTPTIHRTFILETP